MSETSVHDYAMLMWDHKDAEIKSFSTASRSAGSLLKIELLVHDPYTLGDLLGRIAREKQAHADWKRAKASRASKAPGKAASESDKPLLALPAPLPRLIDGREL